ncbi:hypothetical protein ACFQ8C_21625 [Streptomyces sp. NPDC056503]|uniref:hypothetical protein n=1 Tax=Streptomyces sp. NPDC056503 TaxID=3345842 RepID=UPI003698DC7B
MPVGPHGGGIDGDVPVDVADPCLLDPATSRRRADQENSFDTSPQGMCATRRRPASTPTTITALTATVVISSTARNALPPTRV